MSARSDGWVALEEASSAFERPSWAIRALIEQGKLERKVEDGQIYVRAPGASTPRAFPPAPAAPASPGAPAKPPAHDARAARASIESTEPGPVSTAQAPTGPASDLTSAARVRPAPSAADLATELAPYLGGEPLPEIAPSKGTFQVPDMALWSEVAANLADLAHAARARDQLLARTAQALRAVEAATARGPVEPPPARRAPWALALVLCLVSGAGFVMARAEREAASIERDAAELSARRASLHEARAEHERRQAAALAAALLPATLASTGSSTTTLAAGFGR